VIYIYISVRIQDKAWNRQKRNPKDSAEWGSFENKKTTEETLISDCSTSEDHILYFSVHG
jgi:hypothetical protein